MSRSQRLVQTVSASHGHGLGEIRSRSEEDTVSVWGRHGLGLGETRSRSGGDTVSVWGRHGLGIGVLWSRYRRLERRQGRIWVLQAEVLRDAVFDLAFGGRRLLAGCVARMFFSATLKERLSARAGLKRSCCFFWQVILRRVSERVRR